MKFILPLALVIGLSNCTSPMMRKVTSSEAVQNRVLQLCQYQSALGSIETLLSIMYPAVNNVIEEGQGERAAGAICDAVAQAKLNKGFISLPSIKVKIEIETGEKKTVPIEGKVVTPPFEAKPIEAPVKAIEVEKPKE